MENETTEMTKDFQGNGVEKFNHSSVAPLRPVAYYVIFCFGSMQSLILCVSRFYKDMNCDGYNSDGVPLTLSYP